MKTTMSDVELSYLLLGAHLLLEEERRTTADPGSLQARSDFLRKMDDIRRSIEAGAVVEIRYDPSNSEGD